MRLFEPFFKTRLRQTDFQFLDAEAVKFWSTESRPNKQ